MPFGWASRPPRQPFLHCRFLVTRLILNMCCSYFQVLECYDEKLSSKSNNNSYLRYSGVVVRGGVEDTRLEAKDTKKKRGQGQGQPFRGQTLSRPRTGMLEAKDTSASALQNHKNFLGDLQKKKKSSQKFFYRSPQKNVFQKFFHALHKILAIQKIVLSSSRGQANFRGLEASRPRPRTWPSRPRPRTSKCVLEAKDVLEDSTSGSSAIFKEIPLEIGFIKEMRTTWGNIGVPQTFFSYSLYLRKCDLIRSKSVLLKKLRTTWGNKGVPQTFFYNSLYLRKCDWIRLTSYHWQPRISQFYGIAKGIILRKLLQTKKRDNQLKGPGA